MRSLRDARLWLTRWLDPIAAISGAAWWAFELANTRHIRGPLVLNIVFAAVIMGQLLWRRRAPLAFAIAAMGLLVAMTAIATSVVTNTAPAIILISTPYVVAAYEPGRRAAVGLAVCLIAGCILMAITGGTFSDYAFTAGIMSASWAAGRAWRARRMLAEELERKAERLAAEREGRLQLAIADERTRIARELHALVAGSVSTMVVQTEVAERLLDEDAETADEAMAAVEETGRAALAEMRRILGVLRRGEDVAELAPQPGVGQVHSLVQRARDGGRRIELSVEGEPGSLPASVDLGMYRMLEEALESGPGDGSVVLRFRDQDIELAVHCVGAGTLSWPTMAMRERAASCDGSLEVEPVHGPGGRRLVARMPRAFEEVFA